MAKPTESPTVPLAVWPCAQDARRPSSSLHGGVQAEILRRLVTGYTRPGDQVVVVTGRAARPSLAVAETGGHLLVVVPDRRAARDVTAAGRHLGPARRLNVRVGLPAVLVPPVRLVVLTSLSRTSLRPDGPLLAAARLVGPQGILAVVARQRAGRARIDLTPDAVVTAEAAGLTYVQHVVALTRPIHDSRIALGVSHAPRGGRHLTHSDVLVFAAAKGGRR
jgi:hypothetical protein